MSLKTTKSNKSILVRKTTLKTENESRILHSIFIAFYEV